ncbi:MAG: hypothetical protein H7066_00625 [Cytophagaceae bacterium]|nr:hypothetical protein [Gemmatimonadaceae bacterium]
MVDSLRKGLRRAAVFGTILVGAACGQEATAPVQPIPEANAGLISDVTGLVGKLLQVKVLERKSAAPANLVASAVIGKAGGVIEIPRTGFRFVVPPNALDSNVTITVSAVKGTQVAYEFAPHGLKFKKPASFQQDLSHTNALLGLNFGLKGAYFKDASQLNPKSGTALINELIKAFSIGGWVTFPIDHFSGYLVSCA